MALGWHFEQIPTGHGACEPEGQGVLTWKSSGVSGGIAEDEVDALEADWEPVSLRRYAGKERCLILFSAW